MSTPRGSTRTRAFSFASLMALAAGGASPRSEEPKDDEKDEEDRKARRAEEDDRREKEDARRAEEDQEREKEDARRAEEDGDDGDDKNKGKKGKKATSDDEDCDDEEDDTDAAAAQTAERVRWARTLSSPIVAESPARMAQACTLLADPKITLRSATILKTVAAVPVSQARTGLDRRMAGTPPVRVGAEAAPAGGKADFATQVAAAVKKARG